MSDKQTVGVYAAKAEEYASLPFDDDQHLALEMFCDGLPSGAKVFDLGCGPGMHATELKRRGYDVSALDATPAFVDAARKIGVKAVLGTFDDLDADAAYDGIWASFSLLHAPKMDFPRHVAACQRALRPGGRLFLGMKLGSGEKRDGLGRFYAYYSETELRDILKNAGLTVLRVETGAGKGLAGDASPFILMTAHA